MASKVISKGTINPPKTTVHSGRQNRTQKSPAGSPLLKPQRSKNRVTEHTPEVLDSTEDTYVQQESASYWKGNIASGLGVEPSLVSFSAMALGDIR